MPLEDMEMQKFVRKKHWIPALATMSLVLASSYVLRGRKKLRLWSSKTQGIRRFCILMGRAGELHIPTTCSWQLLLLLLMQPPQNTACDFSFELRFSSLINFQLRLQSKAVLPLILQGSEESGNACLQSPLNQQIRRLQNADSNRHGKYYHDNVSAYRSDSPCTEVFCSQHAFGVLQDAVFSLYASQRQHGEVCKPKCVCGFPNSLFQSGTTLFCSPWGKHQPASSSWHGIKPGLTNLLRWCTKGLSKCLLLPCSAPSILHVPSYCTCRQHIWSIQERTAQHPTYTGEVMPCSGLARRAGSKMSTEWRVILTWSKSQNCLSWKAPSKAI